MGKDMSCSCGMHLCSKCSIINIIFGLLFIIAGMQWFVAPWFTGWTLIGAYLFLWGLGTMMMKN